MNKKPTSQPASIKPHSYLHSTQMTIEPLQQTSSTSFNLVPVKTQTTQPEETKITQLEQTVQEPAQIENNKSLLKLEEEEKQMQSRLQFIDNLLQQNTKNMYRQGNGIVKHKDEFVNDIQQYKRAIDDLNRTMITLNIKQFIRDYSPNDGIITQQVDINDSIDIYKSQEQKVDQASADGQLNVLNIPVQQREDLSSAGQIVFTPREEETPDSKKKLRFNHQGLLRSSKISNAQSNLSQIQPKAYLDINMYPNSLGELDLSYIDLRNAQKVFPFQTHNQQSTQNNLLTKIDLVLQPTSNSFISNNESDQTNPTISIKSESRLKGSLCRKSNYQKRPLTGGKVSNNLINNSHKLSFQTQAPLQIQYQMVMQKQPEHKLEDQQSKDKSQDRAQYSALRINDAEVKFERSLLNQKQESTLKSRTTQVKSNGSGILYFKNLQSFKNFLTNKQGNVQNRNGGLGTQQRRTISRRPQRLLDDKEAYDYQDNKTFQSGIFTQTQMNQTQPSTYFSTTTPLPNNNNKGTFSQTNYSTNQSRINNKLSSPAVIASVKQKSSLTQTFSNFSQTIQYVHKKLTQQAIENQRKKIIDLRIQQPTAIADSKLSNKEQDTSEIQTLIDDTEHMKKHHQNQHSFDTQKSNGSRQLVFYKTSQNFKDASKAVKKVSQPYQEYSFQDSPSNSIKKYQYISQERNSALKSQVAMRSRGDSKQNKRNIKSQMGHNHKQNQDYTTNQQLRNNQIAYSSLNRNSQITRNNNSSNQEYSLPNSSQPLQSMRYSQIKQWSNGGDDQNQQLNPLENGPLAVPENIIKQLKDQGNKNNDKIYGQEVSQIQLKYHNKYQYQRKDQFSLPRFPQQKKK